MRRTRPRTAAWTRLLNVKRARNRARHQTPNQPAGPLERAQNPGKLKPTNRFKPKMEMDSNLARTMLPRTSRIRPQKARRSLRVPHLENLRQVGAHPG